MGRRIGFEIVGCICRKFHSVDVSFLLLSPTCYTRKPVVFDAATIAIPVGSRANLFTVWYVTTGSADLTSNNVDPDCRIRSVVDSVDVIVIFFFSRRGVRPIET